MIYRNGTYDLEDPTPWTRFMDMCSGGSRKLEPFDLIYIQEPEDRATALFMLLFDFDPRGVACRCCGSDYAILELPTLQESAAFHIEYHRLRGLKQLVARDDVLVISQSSLRIEHPPMSFEPAAPNPTTTNEAP
jgi:hypothetical protein